MSFLEDTDTHETVNGAQSVEAMRSLIEDTDVTEDAPREALKAELTERAELLAEGTEWTREEFLEHAGCSSAKLVIDGKPPIDFLLACLSYLMWVDNLMIDLDLLRDRRMAVKLSAQLFRDSGRELDRCKVAMEANARSGALSAAGYLRLGEVTRAFHVASASFDSAAGRGIETALLEDPLYASSPHVVDDRIELAWTAPDALGICVARNVREHVISCPACTASYAEKLEKR